jgi:hypothetical protein
MDLLDSLWKFQHSRFFPELSVSPTPNPQLGGPGHYTLSVPYPFNCLAWVALPGAYAPTSVALRDIGALKPPLQDKAVVLEEFTVTHTNTHTLGFSVFTSRILATDL